MHETRALHGGTAPVSSPPVVGEPRGESNRPALCKADLTRDDLTGLSLGQYALGPKIGGGGMGRVFAARHTLLDRPLAIKFIATEIETSPEASLRFDQEIAALGQLQHPHIVNAVDAGCLYGLKYLVTELVDGADLGQLVQMRGRIPSPEACELIRQAALGLAHSHRRGFLHRDIKPSNLFLDRAGTVKILDFGLVRSAGPATPAAAPSQGMTVHGQMLGTFDFIAPEQALDAREADERSDLYSLGCTLVYLLSGETPFSGDSYGTAAAKLKGHLLDQPQWLQSPPGDPPRELVRIVARLLAKSPAQRFPSAEALVEALAPLADKASVAALLSPVDQDSPSPAGDSAAATLSGSLWNGKQARHLTTGLFAVACVVAAVSLRPPHQLPAVMSPEVEASAAEPAASVAPRDPVSPPAATRAPSPTPAPTPTVIPASDPVPEAPDEPKVTQESNTTVNAAPLEFDESVSDSTRLPTAFGSARSSD